MRCALCSPAWEVLAPVRDQAFVRSQQIAYLQEHDFPLPPSGGAYSINKGLWGVSIGGKETLDSKDTIPESEWVLSAGAFDRNLPARELHVGFERGIPVALDGQTLDSVTLIEQLEAIGGQYAIGRGIHLGDTVLGTKGRVAFEAPAADILLNAHRELEKLTLTALQAQVKESLANTYGDFVHYGKQLDPACRDIEALFASTQQRVTGTVKLILRPGNAFIAGVKSPYSLMAATKGVYGEAAGEWTAQDALGFSKILALSGMLQARAAGGNKEAS